MFHVPEIYRDIRTPGLASDSSFGNNGFFIIPHYKVRNYHFRIQVSDGLSWEHISVSVGEVGHRQHRCPTWEEMCWVKKQFWDDGDCVIQYHPSKDQYVNLHPYVLHLWRPTNQVIPIPLKEMIG